mgnify:FL=1
MDLTTIVVIKSRAGGMGVEQLRKLFKMPVGDNNIDKLKTQVKGYSDIQITEKMLKKNKLGDVLTAVCDMGELEREVRDNLKNGLPVMGFFKGKQMWSCFLFEKTEIPKGEISPEPDTGKDTLGIYKLRKSYIHPEVEKLADDMMEVAHSDVYQNVIDVFGDGKSDGFIWKDRIYVCRREKTTGIPYGLIMGIALGIIYGMLLDNIALGISLGVCFGISFGMIWGTSTHRFAEHEMNEVDGMDEIKNSDVDEENIGENPAKRNIGASHTKAGDDENHVDK